MSQTTSGDCETGDDGYAIKVTPRSVYVKEQSDPASNRYVFAYTVTIENVGRVAAKLLSRHWVITDGDGRVEEVRGPGVVGEQPFLRPGEAYRYQSGAVLKTSVGSMEGSYQMEAEDGHLFDVRIPAFTLSGPRVLH